MKKYIAIVTLILIFGFFISCEKENQPPIIQSTTASPQSIKTGETTQLSCVATDPEGDNLTYSWSSINGTFPSGTSRSSVSWKAPDKPETYIISVIVNDGKDVIDDTVNMEIMKIPVHTVSGKVSDEDGNNLPGVIVSLLNPDGNVSNLTTSSDATGFYQLPSVPEGSRIITFEKKGYLSFQAAVIIAYSDYLYNAKLKVKELFGEFTDARDGIVYKWVKIGNQYWMAENLAYDAGEGCLAYRNDENYVETYGRLYSWSVAMVGSSRSSANPSGVQGVCPDGWHLPSDNEWEQLAQYVSDQKGPYSKFGNDWNEVGKHLKAISGWKDNDNSTDDFGFSGLPGGYYSGGYFHDAGDHGYWWSTTVFHSMYGPRRWILSYTNTRISKPEDFGYYSYSVRCVRD